jgi:ubiquinone/menaquinone biosynthesis C-methylase UbiE
MIAEARRRAAGLTLPVSFEVGDVHQVGLPEGSFDLCRTERVLRYVDRPAAVLAQMVRLTRPGGSVVAFDFDSDQTVVDASDPALVRRIAAVLDAAVPHPWIGRQLFRLFQRAGLRDVRIVPHALCFRGAAGFAVYQRLNQGIIDRDVYVGQVSASEAAAWWAALKQAAETETFFPAVLGFIAAGRKAQRQDQPGRVSAVMVCPASPRCRSVPASSADVAAAHRQRTPIPRTNRGQMIKKA